MKKHTLIIAAFCAAAFLPADAAANPGWVLFTSDAGTGVSDTKLYTHAVIFNPGNTLQGDVVLNNVKFDKHGGGGTGTTTGLDGKTYGWSGFPTVQWGGNLGNIATPPG